VYKEWLAQEQNRSAYYEQLYLGSIRNQVTQVRAEEKEFDLSEFSSLSRMTTLSSLRHKAERHSRTMSNQPAAGLASDLEKTDAEKLFEDALNGKEV
tara:strand:- start:6843 stop:7133 length:291 start_codon:yes stop_codon:yes gene_type:complete